MGYLKNIWWWVLNLVFPQACSGCGATGWVLCAGCRHGLTVGQSELVSDGFRVFVACEKSELLRRVVHQFKYKYSEELAAELAGLLVERMRKVVGAGEVDSREAWIAPVPLFWKRERERGFNQSRMLGMMVSEVLGVKFVDILERHRETRVQARLNKRDRAENVRDAFRMRRDFYETLNGDLDKVPKRVFVLDDVITSGATFRECARVLRDAGVEEVCGIMLSHGL